MDSSQAETYQAEITNDTHGTTGPIKISFSKEHINVGINFLEVAAGYDKERHLTDDINAFTSSNHYGVSSLTS
jgi:alcohol oxidase